MTSDGPRFLAIQLQKDDTDLLKAASETFGEAAKPISAHGFDRGLLDALQIAIPVVSATAPFIFKYFTTREASHKKRYVRGSRGQLTLEGYSAAEVAAVLDKEKETDRSRSKR
jgi:hypothetical protein